MVFNDQSSQKTLMVSVLVQASAQVSASSQFFSAFMSQVTAGRGVDVTPQNDGSFSHVLPRKPSYYVYTGTGINSECSSAAVTWIVHDHPVTMHPDDMAQLQKVCPAAWMPVQPLGQRTVMYNDGANGVMSQETLKATDGRLFVVIRRNKQDADARKSRKSNTSGLSVPVSLGPPPAQEKPLLQKAAEGMHGAHAKVKNLGYKNVLELALYAFLAVAGLVLARAALKFVLTNPGNGFLTNAGWLNVMRPVYQLLFWPIAAISYLVKASKSPTPQLPPP
jgi:hypothetical protein